MSKTLSLYELHQCFQFLEESEDWKSPHGVNLADALDVASSENVDTGKKFDPSWDFDSFPLTEEKWSRINWPNDLFGTCIRHDSEWGDGETWTSKLLVADRNASPKPTWAELLSILHTGLMSEIKLARKMELRSHVRDRIALDVYSARDLFDEIFKRMHGGETAEQREERTRLLAKHKLLRAKLETMSVDEISAMNPADDTLWAKD